MQIQDKLRNPFVQQYILEILIPLIGYFWFDWTVEIITLFYLIDQFASELFFLRKLRSIAVFNDLIFFRQILLSALLFLIFILVECYLLYHFFSSRMIDNDARQIVNDQVKIFLVEESWLLIPLVFLMYYMKDQFTFYMPRKFAMKHPGRFFQWHIISETILLVLVVLGVLLFSGKEIEDYLLIIVFLCVKIVFDLTVQKYAETKSDK